MLSSCQASTVHVQQVENSILMMMMLLLNETHSHIFYVRLLQRCEKKEYLKMIESIFF